MFRCEKCQEVTEPYQIQYNVVVTKRQKEYTHNYWSKKDQKMKTSYGKGWEIAMEMKVCKGCQQELLTNAAT